MRFSSRLYLVLSVYWCISCTKLSLSRPMILLPHLCLFIYTSLYLFLSLYFFFALPIFLFLQLLLFSLIKSLQSSPFFSLFIYPPFSFHSLPNTPYYFRYLTACMFFEEIAQNFMAVTCSKLRLSETIGTFGNFWKVHLTRYYIVLHRTERVSLRSKGPYSRYLQACGPLLCMILLTAEGGRA